MKPRRYRQTRPVNEPTKPDTSAIKKPGWLGGKGAREDYAQEVQQREAEFAEYSRQMEVARRRQQRNEILAQENALLRERERMMAGLPSGLRTSPQAQMIGDQVVNARQAGRDAYKALNQNISEAQRAVANIHPAYYVGGGSLVGSAALLNAYNDLESEGLDSGVFPTVGRATGNAVGGVGNALNAVGNYAFSGTIGQDPLALARNNIADSRASLGSDRVLEALVLDAVDPSVPTVEEAVAGINVPEVLTKRAAELMSIPHYDSAGNQKYMTAAQAYSYALDEFKADQKF